ncbi:MAG: hypothetical protein ACJAYP_000786 [Flavobacterium sp.]|jgi:hypothetical protein
MKKLFLGILLMMSITVLSQTKVINKNIKSSILFNSEVTYSYFLEHENKMKSLGIYKPSEEIDLYAIFINDGIESIPEDASFGTIYKSKAGKNVILIQDNSYANKQLLFELLSELYKH